MLIQNVKNQSKTKLTNLSFSFLTSKNQIFIFVSILFSLSQKDLFFPFSIFLSFYHQNPNQIKKETKQKNNIK